MALSLRGSAQTSFDNDPVTDHVVTKEATVASGDVMWAFLAFTDAPGAITAPSGWALTESKDAGSRYLRAYSKTAGASEPSDYTWQSANGTPSVRHFAAVKGTAPAVDVHGNATNAATDAHATASINPTQDGAFIIGAWACIWSIPDPAFVDQDATLTDLAQANNDGTVLYTAYRVQAAKASISESAHSGYTIDPPGTSFACTDANVWVATVETPSGATKDAPATTRDAQVNVGATALAVQRNAAATTGDAQVDVGATAIGRQMDAAATTGDGQTDVGATALAVERNAAATTGDGQVNAGVTALAVQRNALASVADGQVALAVAGANVGGGAKAPGITGGKFF